LRTDYENSRVFCSRACGQSREFSFNNYGEHDKILDIFSDNFSDITSESERSEENDSDRGKASNKTTGHTQQCVNQFRRTIYTIVT